LLAKWAGHVDKFQLRVGGGIIFIHYVPDATATITCKVTELEPGRPTAAVPLLTPTERQVRR
jgi:hypothetical protein